MLATVFTMSDGLLAHSSMTRRHRLASSAAASLADLPTLKWMATPSLPAETFLSTKIIPISDVS